MSSQSENALIEQFHQWIVLEKGGRCEISEVCDFSAKHKKSLPINLGDLRSICSQFFYLLKYHSIEGGSSYVEAVRTLLWTDVPCISKGAIKHISDTDVVLVDRSHTQNLLEFILLQEHKKALSKQTRNDLRKDNSKVDQLLFSGKSLRALSIEENVATSDMAIALLGWKFIDIEKKV